MKRYRIGIQIGFYDEPYEVWSVYAHTEEEALSKVRRPHWGHRFLRVMK